MMIFSNSTFMGYPVIRVIFGRNGIFYASVVNMVFMLLTYTYGLFLFCGDDKNKKIGAKGLLSPMILSSFAAFAMSLSRVKISDLSMAFWCLLTRQQAL